MPVIMPSMPPKTTAPATPATASSATAPIHQTRFEAILFAFVAPLS